MSGWQPRVGVGQNPWVDEEEERRLRERFAWDPMRRLQEWGAGIQQDPVAGTLRAVSGAVSEPITAALSYPLGVLQGGVQAGMEAYAGRPIPRSLRMMPHGDFGDEPERLLPAVRNVLDPAEASARYRAITPEPWQFAMETALGLGTSNIGRLPAMASARLAERISPGTAAPWEELLVEPAVSAAGHIPDVARAALTAATSVPARWAAGLGAPTLAAGAMAASAPEDASPRERVERAAEGALLGLVPGLLMVGAQATASNSMRLLWQYPIVPKHSGRVPINKLLEDELEFDVDRAKYANVPAPIPLRPGVSPPAVGPPDPLTITPEPALYPRGNSRLWVDTVIRSQLTDPVAALDTLGQSIKKRRLAQALSLTGAEDFYQEARLLPGQAARFENWVERGIPVPGLEEQIQVLGIKPLLNQAGIKTPTQLRELERLELFHIGLQRANAPKPLATGQLGDDATAIQAALDAQLARIDDLFGPGAGARYNNVARGQTDFLNEGLRDYGEAGFLHPLAVQKAIDENDVYALLQTVDTHFDAIWSGKPMPSTPLTPTGTAVKEWYNNPRQRLDVNIVDTMEKAARMGQLAAGNRLMGKLVQALDENPDEMLGVMRPWPKTGASGTTSGAAGAGGTWSADVPDGWAQLAHWVDGEEQRYIAIDPMAKMLRGLNETGADVMTGAMRNFAQVFRKGVTVWSLPFILGNVPRDLHAAMVNSGMPADVLRHYLSSFWGVLTKDVDQWYRQNQMNPHVQSLPEKIWEGLDQFVMRGGRREFHQYAEARVGMSDLTSNIADKPRMHQRLGLEEPKSGIAQAGQALATPVTKMGDLLEWMSAGSEMTTRMAVFRAGRGRGMPLDEAGLRARTSTVDFQKIGSAMRIANMWFPLLNARMQGTIRSLESARDDPYGFAVRMMILDGMPQMMEYAWNRTMFGDLYDQIPSEERLRNHIIIYGGIKDDNDRVRPAYLRMPKDDMGAMFTVPTEHFLDAVYRTRYHGEPLPEHQRTDVPTGRMLMRLLGHMLPTDTFPDEMMNPIKAIPAAFLAMNPIGNLVLGTSQNVDPFRDMPIVPEEQMVLPPEYRWGPQTPAIYKATSHSINRILKGMGQNPRDYELMAPSMLQFITRSIGGTAPDYLAQQLDLAIPAMQAAGLVEPTAFRPTSPEDLQLPPGVPRSVGRRYVEQLAAEDHRPLYMRVFSRWFGSSARAQSLTERAKMMGPSQYESARQTQDFWRSYQDRLTDIVNESNTIDTSPDLTHQNKLERIQRQSAARKEAFDSLHAHYNRAIVDRQQMKEFRATLPGIGPETWERDLPALPEGWTRERVASYVKTPPGPDGQAQDLSTMPELARYQLQRRAYAQLSNQLKMPVDVLEMYVAAQVLGSEVPAIPVPNLSIEDAINRYMNPTNERGQPMDRTTTPSHLFRRGQDAVLQTVAAEWKVDQAEVDAIIKLRLTQNPLELTPDGLSRARATAVWQRIHDPQQFPEYVDANGKAFGDEASWAQWNAMLSTARERYRGRLPEHLRQYDQMRRMGELRRIDAVWRGDDAILQGLPQDALADYERWYGLGRSMTSRQWAEYQGGALPRYTSGGPGDWARWDMQQRFYSALPAGSMKRGLRGQIRRIRGMQTPGWRELLQQDQLIREETLWEGVDEGATVA